MVRARPQTLLASTSSDLQHSVLTYSSQPVPASGGRHLARLCMHLSYPLTHPQLLSFLHRVAPVRPASSGGHLALASPPWLSGLLVRWTCHVSLCSAASLRPKIFSAFRRSRVGGAASACPA